jgi:hypothetical protein
MAVVDETAFVMLICGFWAAVLYAAYLRVFVVRNLRKRVDLLVDQRLAAAPALIEENRSPAELHMVNRRLEVLERIVTDRGVQTAAEIEALR